jgi:tetratricopeptide (TPR) repeat protein
VTGPRVMAMIAACILGAPPAGAEAGGRDDEQARRHFERGEELYRDGRYGEAIDELYAAYEIAKLPPLLFNIAQAYRLAGDLEEAVGYYEEFLALAPDHPLASEAREKLALLRKLRDEDRALAQKVADAGESEAGAGPDGSSEAAGPYREPARPGAAVVDELGEDRGEDLRLGGVLLGVAGVAALAAGGYYGFRAHTISGELSRHDGAWTAELLAKQDQGRAAQQRMLFGAGAGALAVAAGAGLYLYGRSQGRARAGAAVGVAGAPDGFLVTLAGRWR